MKIEVKKRTSLPELVLVLDLRCVNWKTYELGATIFFDQMTLSGIKEFSKMHLSVASAEKCW